MAERTIATVLKTVEASRSPGVRIPLPPPHIPLDHRTFRWITVGAPDQAVDIVQSPPHGGRSPEDGDALLTLVTKGSIQAAIY